MNAHPSIRLWLAPTVPAARAALAAGLSRLGVRVVDDAEDGADLAVRHAGPPGPGVVAICQLHAATTPAMPLILCGPFRSEADRVLALESGADDCIGPECSPRELLARARAVLRRGDTRRRPAPPSLVKLGDWEFCAAQRCLRRGGEQRPLSVVELGLLAALTERPGTPLARPQILGRWASGRDGIDPRAVDTAVLRLRRLIEPDPARPRLIRTVRGHGYCFVPDD